MRNPEMSFRSLIYALFILAMGLCASYALLDATARTQADREATLQARLDLMKPGTSIKLNGYSYLKVGKGGYDE
jgi:hypothetical protein